MNKKILILSIFLIVAGVSLTAVCAADHDVNTPDGYKINNDLTVKNQKVQFQGMDAIQTIYVLENGTDNITLTTFDVDHLVDFTPSGGSVSKNIKNKDGIYQEKDGRYIFLYKDQDQFIQIDAPSEKLIEEVLP